MGLRHLALFIGFSKKSKFYSILIPYYDSNNSLLLI